MMLQKKRINFKNILHSIPIGSIVALLLLSFAIINPNTNSSSVLSTLFPFLSSHSNNVYAVEDGNVGNGNDSTSDSSTSLIIGGAEMNEVVDASVGEVAYRKHTVTISASKLKSYTLFISGPEGLDGESTITGANGNTPVDMPNNSWGYAYGQEGNENNMTYSSFTNNAILIDSKVEDSSNDGSSDSTSSNNDTDFTKNLVFAVKFGNAIAGHYTGTVTLSLAAEPKEVVLPTNPVETWEELQSMQQMTSKACASIGTAGSGNYPSKTLVDSRDGNEYTITKLDDQNCWMTTNLKLDLSTAELTSADSNVSASTPLIWNGSSDTTLVSSSSGFSGGTESTSKWNNGTGVTNSDQWKDEYGYYYNWCAATAGSCKDATTDGAIASASICPKGWRLPTKAEYDILLSKDSGWDSVLLGRIFSGGFFPAAGGIRKSTLQAVSIDGDYWSSTADDTDYAYNLFFARDGVGTDIQVYSGRYNGYSVRCIAQTEQDEKEQEETIKNTPVDNWNDMEYMQQMSPQACESAGIAGSGNYPTKTLKDSRDNSEYTVTKLDDQKCWMTQNLKLDISTANSLTPANSNVSSNWPSNTLASSTGDFTDTTANKTNPHWNNGTGVINSGQWKSEYGYYYNYCAATAGQGRYCTGATTTNNDSDYSICPKGWRLPTHDEQVALNNAGSTWGTVDGVNGRIFGGGFFPAAGLVLSGSLNNVGSGGYYWSSTADSSTNAYDLNFSSSNVRTGYDARYYGFSMRCIAQ